MDSRNETLREKLSKANENLDLLDKLEEMQMINEDAAKERDQVSEILMKILDGINSPKLSQVYSELKYLNSQLRRAKNREIETRFDETDVDIIERKIGLLMDELTLCIDRMTTSLRQNSNMTYSPMPKKTLDRERRDLSSNRPE